MFAIIGFHTDQAILRKRSQGYCFTLKDAHNSDNCCSVVSRYILLALTSDILTQANSPLSSKYFLSSIGRGEAHLFIFESIFNLLTSQSSGISPIHGIPLSFIFAFGSIHFVTARWIIDCFCSLRSSMSFLLFSTSFLISVVFWSRKLAMAV